MKKCISVLLLISLIFTSTFSYAEGTIKLPAKLKTIAAEAFTDTSAFSVVDVFWKCDSIETVYVGNQYVADYMAATYPNVEVIFQ